MDQSTPAHVDPSSSLDRRLLLGAAGLAGVAALSSLTSRAGAGPLNPPAGAVAATGKTLTEVEPRTVISAANTPGTASSTYRITQAGSYYLAGNITGEVNKHGIEIAADGVALDLNGFDLSGSAGMTSLSGVKVTGGIRQGIEVRNGRVKGWSAAGIDLGINTSNSIVRDMRITQCGTGVLAGTSTVVSGCVVSDALAKGISTNNFCRVQDCTVSNCAGTGIESTGEFAVSNCTSRSNGVGLVVGSESSITRCSVLSNVGLGIDTGDGCIVEGCCVSANGGVGIDADAGARIEGCIVQYNSGHGIDAGTRCVVRSNTCRANGVPGAGAGIRVIGVECIVNQNLCSFSFRGVVVTGTRNLITGNTCSSNTANWDIAANNNVGTIVSAGINASAILGSTYAGGVSTTDPHANFSH